MAIDREVIEVDVCVVGAGGAGLRVAHEAALCGADTLVMTKGRIAVSGATAVGLASSAGFAVPDGSGDPEDNEDVHYNDIMTAAQGCADPKLVRILVSEAVDAVADLDRWNIDFIRDPESGKPLVAQGDFASRPRNRKIYHHGKPITVALKRENAKLGVKALEQTAVLSLIHGPRGVEGVIAVTKDGTFLEIRAGATVLTTGGAGQLFKHSLMPPDITGDGYALGYRAGAPLANMEFMQAGFGTVKPALNMLYTWFWAGLPSFVDKNGKPVVEDTVPPSADIEAAMLKKVDHYPFSSSDASRWLEIATKNAMRQGRADEHDGFYLDLRGTKPDKIPQKGFVQLWNVSKDWLLKKNIDVDEQPLRVGLFGHAINGGIVIDEHGQTAVPGLLSAGENAAGPYGADRPGGNMLLNCLVFGKRVGKHAAEVAKARGRIASAEANGLLEDVAAQQSRSGKRSIKEAHTEIKQTMSDHALVVRNAEGLEQAQRKLGMLADAMTSGDFAIKSRKDLVDFYEARNLVDVGRAMCAAASLRKETRGSHYREDAPQADPGMARPIIIRLNDKGAPQAEFGAFRS
ncbi:L-aspartate oxidase [Ensifer psoraleae]|uniref:FAD-binding protein n=1 Tax=Sinorhizobium psoraleae TaxID=520838 RepID=UPI001568D7E3|nr:FAD-binding protein [Sinorhizobium psoraleae]NRP72177.1 L-aspartate oxidase [Sinorhizobium psoraleae]